MSILHNLLKKGYFANELPPMFNTDSFASAIESVLNDPFDSLPDDFIKQPGHNSRKSDLIKHSIPNRRLRRRTIGIPNPLNYFLLCKTIDDYWNEIKSHCSKSQISQSKLIGEDSDDERVVNIERGIGRLDSIKLDIRSTSRYLLRTDIAQFYPSVYTHSIPWAIHSKPKAKSKRKYTSDYYGNIIDLYSRNLQDAQTIGIPIGPDTSQIISEIILSAFDEKLQEALKDLSWNGFRYVDDFELGFRTYGDAERALSIIQNLLGEFELKTNQDKTEIIELPVEIDPTWVAELRNYPFRNESEKTQRSDLFAYIDKVIYLSRENSKDNIFKYAVRQLMSIDVFENNWVIIQDFLFQCLTVESSTFQAVLKTLRFYSDTGYPINLQKLQDIMNIQIQEKCFAGHNNEVCWALWAVIYWQLDLAKSSIEILSKMSDSAIVLMTLHAREEGCISYINTSDWEKMLSKENDVLYGSQWLLAYEANIKGWLTYKTDYVADDPNFNFLWQNNVSFYDVGRKNDEFMISYDPYTGEEISEDVQNDVNDGFDTLDINDIDLGNPPF